LYTEFGERWFSALCRGETEAFEFLLNDELGQRIIRRCRAMAQELKQRKYLRQEEADDFLQECLIAIHQAAQRYEPGGLPQNVGGLLWRVAERACIGVMRRAQGTADGLKQADDVKDESGERRPAIAVYDTDPDSATGYDEVTISDLIERAGIRPEGQQVLRLWLDGYPVLQVAERLGLPAATVRSRFLSALGKLRKAMGA